MVGVPGAGGRAQKVLQLGGVTLNRTSLLLTHRGYHRAHRNKYQSRFLPQETSTKPSHSHLSGARKVSEKMKTLKLLLSTCCSVLSKTVETLVLPWILTVFLLGFPF